MAPKSISAIAAVRKRNLLVEFSSLKHASPEGVYVSLAPGDPTLWSGVIFVRKGPYAPSVLRFRISFPPNYPSLPPLVSTKSASLDAIPPGRSFEPIHCLKVLDVVKMKSENILVVVVLEGQHCTDIFHPLITPLTTYLYTTDIQDGGTVSATDEERLPPGGFSLRNGFPNWFGRTNIKGTPTSRPLASSPARTSTPMQTPDSTANKDTLKASVGVGSSPGRAIGSGRRITIYEVLRYIRSAFDDETVLDLVPIEAAGNPGAWYAWRAYRIKSGAKIPPHLPWKGVSDTKSDVVPEDNSSSCARPPEDGASQAGGTTAPTQARQPGEWNWEGVWEVRAKKGIDTSISEHALYGKDAGDDLIRFMNLEGSELDNIKKSIKTLVEGMEVSGRTV